MHKPLEYISAEILIISYNTFIQFLQLVFRLHVQPSLQCEPSMDLSENLRAMSTKLHNYSGLYHVYDDNIMEAKKGLIVNEDTYQEERPPEHIST